MELGFLPQPSHITAKNLHFSSGSSGCRCQTSLIAPSVLCGIQGASRSQGTREPFLLLLRRDPQPQPASKQAVRGRLLFFRSLLPDHQGSLPWLHCPALSPDSHPRPRPRSSDVVLRLARLLKQRLQLAARLARRGKTWQGTLTGRRQADSPQEKKGACGSW